MSRPVISSLRWSVLTLLGLAFGFGLGLAAGGPVEALVGMILVTPVLTALAGGAFGSVQWLGARRTLSAGWIVASMVGLGAGLALGVVAVELTGRAITGEQVNVRTLSPPVRAVSLAVVGIACGLALGACQGWILRRRYGKAGQGRWLRASVLGFGGGLALGSLAADTVPGGFASPLGFVVLVAVGGGLAGWVTGRELERTVVAGAVLPG